MNTLTIAGIAALAAPLILLPIIFCSSGNLGAKMVVAVIMSMVCVGAGAGILTVA